VTLTPNGSFTFHGKFTPTVQGSYQFKAAYRTPEGDWKRDPPALNGLKSSVDVQVYSVTRVHVPDARPAPPCVEPPPPVPSPAAPRVELGSFFGSSKIAIEKVGLRQTQTWCEVRMTVRNLTDSLVMVTVGFNALDESEVGIAFALTYSRHPARARNETSSPLMEGGGGVGGMRVLKSCATVRAIRLDGQRSSVQ
jgi:hypothetical protein